MTTSIPSIPQLEAEARKLFMQGQLDAAANIAQYVIKLQPKNGNALNLLGVIAVRLGRKEEALDYLGRLVTFNPKAHEAQANLANALAHFKMQDRAIPHYLEAIRLAPKTASYRHSLGVLHLQFGQLEAARQQLEQAWKLDPKNENTALGLYDVYRAQGESAAHEELTRQTTVGWSTKATHWLNRAEALLSLGSLKEGWSCYRWRFKDSVPRLISRAIAGVPVWAGEDISQKSVLVFTEQGPGDEVLCGTMIADIIPRVGRLSILCSARIAPLFRRSFPDIDIFSETVPDAAKATLDVQTPLLDFAEIVRPVLEAFPPKASYLKADGTKAAELRAIYKNGSDDLLVGIAWRSQGVEGAPEKSVSLGFWGAVFGVPNVRFVNLQYGDCATDLEKIEQEYKVNVIADGTINPLVDLDSYAAQVAAMDVVVSSSNTAAHFAGALGIACKCMLPFAPSQGRRWYWIAHGDRSVWYPSTKLFIKDGEKSWVDVVSQVALDLVAQVSAAGHDQGIAGYLYQLGKAYRDSGQEASALGAFKALSEIASHEFTAFFELGVYAKQREQFTEALQYFDLALQHQPDSSHALNFKGMICAAQGNYESAESYYRRALASNPDSGEVLNNLGTAVHRQGRGLEAHDCYLRAHECLPTNTEILQNLSVNLVEINRPNDAIAYFDLSLALKPENADAHLGRAFALLTAGRFVEGWPEMWWRERSIPNLQRPPDNEPPRWAGQSLADCSILVWTEYGLGEEILALTMLPDVIAAAKNVTVLCSTRLVKLVARSFPTIRILDRAEQQSLDLSTFDYQMSISELGGAFRSSLDLFPHHNGFLRANPKRQEALRRKYFVGGRPVVGLSWASGNPKIGTLKSLTLQQMVSGILPPGSQDATLVSLQYGDHAPEINQVNAALNSGVILDREIDAIRDVDGFVAQVAAMDLVITVSNTTVHAAGALGIPTLLLVPFNRARQWYWLRASADCKWYPSVKYVYQSMDGSWDEALKICKESLSQVI